MTHLMNLKFQKWLKTENSILKIPNQLSKNSILNIKRINSKEKAIAKMT